MNGKNGKNGLFARLLGIAAVLALAAPVSAVTVPFTEDFSVDASGWLDATSGPLTWNASGGPDGGAYASATGASISDPGTIQLRTNGAASSGGNLAGDWLSAGVSVLSAQVLHDAPAPLNVFFRITTGTNSPAIIGVVPIPVLSNTWTSISLVLSPSNPLIIPEGPPSIYNTVLSNVTNVQLGFAVPLELEGVSFTYGVDKVAIAPEPATAALLAGGLALLAAAGRRRTAQR